MTKCSRASVLSQMLLPENSSFALPALNDLSLSVVIQEKCKCHGA